VCVSVCVCVCEREREREREKVADNKATLTYITLFMPKRKIDRQTETTKQRLLKFHVSL
jgi:hypothetical protein